MKHKNNVSDFIEERNQELLCSYKHLLSITDVIVPTEIYKQLVKMPSTRFWVSEWRASIVLSRMFSGDKLQNMQPTKRSMYQEIFRRAKVILRKNPGMPMLYVAFEVVNSPAPRFFMTPGSACRIINRYKQQLRSCKK
jgi:hypothetical protein